MTKRNLASKMLVTKTCTVWLVSRNKPESIPSSAALEAQTPCLCLIHLENYSAITGNKQNNWLRMAETPPDSHSSHLQTLAYRGKVAPLEYQLQLLEQLRVVRSRRAPGDAGQGQGWSWNSPAGAAAALCTPVPPRGLRAHRSCSLLATPVPSTRKEKSAMSGFWKSWLTQVEAIIKEKGEGK